jgi:Ni/Co efflux regulator RcnB
MKSENLKNLKKEYENAKKTANSREEKKEMRADYKKAKNLWKKIEKLNKKYRLDETPEEFWARQNIPTFEEYMKNLENKK